MTKQLPPYTIEGRAVKAARARRLTDPLAAMGFREARERIDSERRVRRIAFVSTLLGFAGFFGLLTVNAALPETDVAGGGATSVAADVPANANLTDPSRYLNVSVEQPVRPVKTPTATPKAHKRSRSS